MVTTSLRHNLSVDSKVLLRDTVDDADGTPEWWLDVVYIVNQHSFVMKTVSRDEPPERYRDWSVICQCFNNNTYTLRAKNPNIPEKAARLGINTYLWREPTSIFDGSDAEFSNYVFANNSIYVDDCFNFYLKRQDPFNVNGLYFDGSKCRISCPDTDCDDINAIDKQFLGDVESKTDTSESKFEYNEQEYQAQC